MGRISMMKNLAIVAYIAQALLFAPCKSMSLVENRAMEYNEQVHNQIDDQLASDEMLIRNVRREKSNSGVVKPYLLFQSKPPVTVTVNELSGHVLECEATGNPRPQIYWTVNNRIVTQGSDNTRIHPENVEAPTGNNRQTLGLTLVKSRLYLDCITQSKHQAVYGCVAFTPFERQVTHTKVIVRPTLDNSDVVSQQLLDLQTIPNGHNSASSPQGKARSCIDIKKNASPARIFFWTSTNLEYIGSSAVLHCRADGFPRPRVSWFDSNDREIVNNDQFQVHTNGDLYIRNVTFNEMGKYRCNAENIYGSDSADKIFLYPTAMDEKTH